MQLMRLDEIPENTRLGQSIFDERGLLLLGEGYPLKKYEMAKIRSLGYEYLYVDTPQSEKVTIVPALTPRVDAVLHKVVTEQFHRIFDRVQRTKYPPEHLRSVIEKHVDFQNSVDINEAVIASRLMIEDLELNGMEPLDTFLLKGKATYLADHSINTALIAVLLGYRFGLRRNDLIELVLASLFHCCGQLFLPELIGRDELLFDEREASLFRLYPELSERVLASSTDRFFRSRLGILHHRERQDGKGFPKGLTGTNQRPNFSQHTPSNTVYPMAEIVSVAASFDEYVGRGFGVAMSPEEAALNVIARINSDLNTQIVETWLNICSLFPPGVTIKILRCPDRKLVGGFAIVQKTNWSDPHKPRVVLMADASGNPLNQTEIDLAEFDYCRIRMIL
ncbi:MAG: hypothetical protein OEM52_11570 [bacterium]|nr:hypothetical protein [bacterium]